MTLPLGWSKAGLLDVTYLHDSRRVPLNRDQRAKVPGVYPYYGANGQVDTVGDYLFEGSYILLAEDGGYFDQPERGVAYEVCGRFWVNNHAHILSLSDGVVQNYLVRFLNTLDWLKYVSGTTRLKLTQEGMRQVFVPLPPSGEQRRIVAKLNTLTARLACARAELKRVPALAKKYREFTLDQAYRGELTRRWRIESPSSSPVVGRSGHELRAKYRTEGLEAGPYELPGGWRWWRLPALGGLDRGKSRHRPRNDPRLFGGSHPFIQTGDIRAAGQYLATFSETYSELGLAQSRKWPIGTVCITIAANIAETTVLDIPACFPDSVVGFEADAGRVFPEFIEYFIRTAKLDLARFAPSTAQKNINLDTLSALVVPVAPYEEQKAILEKIKVAFARADRLEAEAARARVLLDRLEAAILARAFRGELVPQDPDDEPASVLLDRIRARRAAGPKPLRRRRAAATSA